MTVAVVLLSIVGLICYACIGACVGKYMERTWDIDTDESVPCAIFWPAVLAIGLIFCIGWVLTWPARWIWTYEKPPPPAPEPAPEDAPAQPILNFPGGTPPLTPFEE